MPHRLMVLPSLACPASCVYCFGPRKGGPRMGRETLEALAWNDAPLEFTFHGGEPLTAGAGFYRAEVEVRTHATRTAAKGGLVIPKQRVRSLARDSLKWLPL